MSALAGLIAVIAAFEVSYTGINLLVTKTQPSAVVSNWARSTPARTDAILAAAYFCTDMENRCYAYYQFARDSTQLLTTLTDYHISYVVYDQAQWPAWAGTFLQAHFPVAETWSFGSAYDVRPSPH